jgi:hypothetical protein
MNESIFRVSNGFALTIVFGMKQILGLLLCGFSLPLLAGSFPEGYAPLGKGILTNFASAPFPHPDRAQGHHYGDKFFPAGKHYSDSSVAIFVPKGFQAKGSTDFVVHFHGWGGNVTSVFGIYKTAEQLVESGRNAILVVPQGPLNASDSFGGETGRRGWFQALHD